MFKSIRSRLFLTYLLITGLVLMLVALSLFIFLLRNPFLEQLAYRRLEASSSVLTLQEGQLIVSDRAGDRERILSRIDSLSGARTLLIGPDGAVLGDSRPESPPLPARVLVDGSAVHETQQGRFRLPGEGIWLYIAQPLARDHTLILAVPRQSALRVQAWGDELLRPLLQTGVVALLLAIVFSWLISRWVAAPLGRMAKASQAVANGDYSHKIVVDGPLEVESLARSFNEMVDRVEQSQTAERDFVANVSHELKTPLTSIRGFAQAILDGTAESLESQHHAAEVIYDEADRLHRLVEDLLDLARIDTGQMVFERNRVDLNALLNTVVERLAVRASTVDVKLQTRLHDLPAIIGDGDRLAQVFMNLIDNAIKHSPRGGTVLVSGEVIENWVSIHVDDAGSGIPEEELSRIFERFYQLDKARTGGEGRGVGLGLAISREIVAEHAGRVVAQSSSGKGSRFTVQLPITRPDDRTLVHHQS